MADINPSPSPPASAGSVAAQPHPSGGAVTDDPLASLKHMSTTAGLGVGEYVAINPLAVVALLLGIISLLAPFFDILLIAAALGLGCGIIAVRQIKGSNGTQTGLPLAITGLALSAVIGCGMLAYKAIDVAKARGHEKQIAAAVEALGNDLGNGRYDQAYDRFSDHFHARVSRQKFTERMKLLSARYGAGPLREMRWNNQALPVDDAPPDMPAFVTMAVVRFENEKPEEAQTRFTLQLIRVNGKWVIESMPGLFPLDEPTIPEPRIKG